MQQVTFNDDWRRLPGIIYRSKIKINWQKGALVAKTEEQNTQANEYLNRCLINQNHESIQSLYY